MTAQATPLQTATMCGQILVNVFQTIAILGMMTVAWPEIFQTTSKSFKAWRVKLHGITEKKRTEEGWLDPEVATGVVHSLIPY